MEYNKQPFKRGQKVQHRHRHPDDGYDQYEYSGVVELIRDDLLPLIGVRNNHGQLRYWLWLDIKVIKGTS
jgi:hypothetical protein